MADEMRALITGVCGFVGGYLSERLVSGGYKVFGTRRSSEPLSGLASVKGKVKLLECDLTDVASLEKAVKKAKPDLVFHLAAQSSVTASWQAPQETLSTNIVGTVNLLEALRKYGCDARIQVSGSSDEYGLVYASEVPIKETNPLRPLSPYGVSKVATDLLACQYCKSYGLKTVVTRSFNIEGPGRGEAFATSNFSKQIAEIEAGLRKPVVSVGNLDAVRDYSDVRDVVVAMELAALKGEPGEAYNVCSGKGLKVRQMLDLLLGRSTEKILVKPDPARMRPADVPLLIGDSTKLRKRTGWAPKIPFEKTMGDMLDYWRARVASKR